MNKGIFLLLIGVWLGLPVLGNRMDLNAYNGLLTAAPSDEITCNEQSIVDHKHTQKDLSPPIFVDLVFNQGAPGCFVIDRTCTGESCRVVGRASNVSCGLPLTYRFEEHTEDSSIFYYEAFWIEITQLVESAGNPMMIRVQPEYTPMGGGVWNYHVSLFYSSGILQPVGYDGISVLRSDSSLISHIFFDAYNERLTVNTLVSGYELKIFNSCEFITNDCGGSDDEVDPHPNPDNSSGFALSSHTNGHTAHETIQGRSSKTTTTSPLSNNWKIINPIGEEITILFEHPLKNDSHLSIYRIDGQLLEQSSLLAGQSSHTMPASYLLPGVYLVKLDTALGVEIKMVVKY